MKLYATLLTLIYVLTVAQALPADIDVRAAPATTRPQTNPVDNTKTPKEVPCDVISKYSVNWFLANVCVKPKPSTCLFYTRGLSLKAKAYAKAHKPEMTTIWEMWDASLYSLAKRPRNPLRCIMSNAAQRLEYFRNMSTAMASLCDVGATVMDASVSPTKKTFATVRQDGIWGTHEFPTLQKGAPGNTPADPPGNLLGKKVNLIEAISTDGKTSFQYWVRPGVKVKGAKREMLRGVEAREAEIVEARKTCAKLTDAEIKELDEIPW